MLGSGDWQWAQKKRVNVDAADAHIHVGVLTRVLSLAQNARERPNQFVGEQQPPTDSPVPFESNRSATTTNGRGWRALLAASIRENTGVK